MEYMGIWEAQHIGVIQSVEYVACWVGFLSLLGILFYRSKQHFNSSVQKCFRTTIYFMYEREFISGQVVFIRDYPYGKPLNLFGKVVGYVGIDRYNIVMMNGLQEGSIVSYKEWRLISERDAECFHKHRKN